MLVLRSQGPSAVCSSAASVWTTATSKPVPSASSLFIASHCIAADHGERSRADVIAIATQHLVAEG